MAAVKHDIEELRKLLKDAAVKEQQALEAQRAVAAAISQSNGHGLIDPVSSAGGNQIDIDNATMKYFDDYDEIANERVNALRLVEKDADRILRRLEQSCQDHEEAVISIQDFKDCKTENLAMMLERMIHKDMKISALCLTKYTQRYNEVHPLLARKPNHP